MQQPALVKKSHLSDSIVGSHNASPNAAIHDLTLETIGDTSCDKNEEDLTMEKETRVQESAIFSNQVATNIINGLTASTTCYADARNANLVLVNRPSNEVEESAAKQPDRRPTE